MKMSNNFIVLDFIFSSKHEVMGWSPDKGHCMVMLGKASGYNCSCMCLI